MTEDRTIRESETIEPYFRFGESFGDRLNRVYGVLRRERADREAFALARRLEREGGVPASTR